MSTAGLDIHAAAMLSDREDALHAIKCAKARLAGIEALLREHVTEHGPIETPEGKWCVTKNRVTLCSDEDGLTSAMALYLRDVPEDIAADCLRRWFSFTRSGHPCRLGELEKDLGAPIQDAFVSQQRIGADGEPSMRFAFIPLHARKSTNRRKS